MDEIKVGIIIFAPTTEPRDLQYIEQWHLHSATMISALLWILNLIFLETNDWET